jgi:hypothetical protein
MHKEIINHLNEIITKLLKNPLMFVSEADVHKFVMWELMKIKELNPENLVETSCSIGINNAGVPSKVGYKTTLIHSEYGNQLKKKERSDIVILNIEDVKKIDDPLDLKTDDLQGNKNWIIPDYILEFGTEKSAKSAEKFKEHIEKDLAKIANSKVNGFLIHIHRNYIKSKEGYLKLNKAKIDEYIQRYAQVIKNNEIDQDKIRVLIAIVDIGNEGRRATSKIRLLKDPLGEPYLDRVNINDIKENVFKLLN